jgi:pentatricopeptide repeat protein
MIAQYLKFAEGNLALNLFQQMHQEGVQPDPIIYMSVLDVSANVDALETMEDVLSTVHQG